ncbi:MAG: putative redox protein [Bacteroidia bacterium]|jgi:putative redox protein
MGYKVNTVWKGKMAFESQLGNHTVRMDTTPEMGDDSGASPKQLLLAGLAGCTGMDVVSLLNKMRVPFTNFEMDIEADLTEEHPIVFSEIRLKYVFWGKNLDNAKVEKAVNLSQERYCGVSAMLKKNSPINYSIEYRG